MFNNFLNKPISLVRMFIGRYSNLCTIAFIIFGFGVTSCTPKENSQSEQTSPCISSGDIVVSNSASDVVLVLYPNGLYKNIAFNVSNIAETVYGLAWSLSGELLVAVDGADRIVAVNPSDCSSRTFIADVNLTGNLRGITQLTGGDVLVVETSNIEKFNSLGFRVTAGGWPRALQTTATDVNKMSNGGFVHCSTGADVVRTYDAAGTQVNTVASGIAATTDAAGCLEMSDGNIVAVWSGTTDTVRIYSPNLGSTVASYSDVSLLSTPGSIAQRSNGNLLIVDRVLHYIVEITSSGTFVNIIGDGVLNTPEHILVVP